MSELREKLKTEIDQADWSMLKPHYEKNAVFLIEADIDLITAGVAVAEDKSQIVSMWLTDKKMYRPTDEQVKSFEADQYKKRFNFIIIQPYVLVQLIDSDQLN